MGSKNRGLRELVDSELEESSRNSENLNAFEEDEESRIIEANNGKRKLNEDDVDVITSKKVPKISTQTELLEEQDATYELSESPSVQNPNEKPTSIEASDSEFEISADDELLMHNYTTLPDECKKFWKKRYRLFSKFDEGIYMTSELWYSVTPESIAIFVARLFSYLIPEAKCAVDLCCGGGGNTIQFAKYFKSTIGIDINPTNVQCTEHNAQIYGVGENIFTVVGDWNEMSKVNDNGSVKQDWIPMELRNPEYPQKTFDFIFSSPPWGGPAYTKKGQEFDLHTMEPFPIERLIQQCLQYTENIGLFLPKSSNLSQISQATKKFFGNEGSCRVIYINSTGYCVGMLALMGPKVTGELDYDQFFSTEFGEE